MIDNVGLLKDLLSKGKIRLQDSDILYQTPPTLPQSFTFDRIEGMMMGLAAGDALGAPSEGYEAPDRRKYHGEIRDYQADWRTDFRATGTGTDDTQLAFWTLEALIDDGGLIPLNLARKFCVDPIWGVGGTTRNFVESFRFKHIPWYDTGMDVTRTGALMRIAPVLIPYLRNPHPSLFADTAIATMMTHNSFANNAATIAYVKMLWALLGMNEVPKPEWWLDTYCSALQELEGDTEYPSTKPAYSDYSGPLWKFTREVCTDAFEKGLSTEGGCLKWGSGAYLLEMVPSVIYILMKHADSTEEAIIRAVNDTQDNDTAAAIVGAAMGALHGLKSIPDRWIKRLTGKTREGEAGQIFRVLMLAKQAFWLNETTGK